jgi:hypothetical protein
MVLLLELKKVDVVIEVIFSAFQQLSSLEGELGVMPEQNEESQKPAYSSALANRWWCREEYCS